MERHVASNAGPGGRPLVLVPAALDSLVPLADTLIGLGVGAAAGRLVVYRRERGDRELSARRAREITTRWELFLALLGGLVGAGLELL